MEKAFRTIVIVIVIVLLGLLIMVCFFHEEVKTFEETPYVEKIDSLENVIKQLEERKDSVIERIDTVYLKIANNNKHYEETRNTILNNNANEDLEFFTNYIQRFSNNNN